MNKIRTLGGTNHHVSLRVSNTPSPYNTLFVSLSALTLVCLSHHRVCWAVSFSWTAVERRSWSQFFLKMKHRRLFNQISYLVFSLLHFVILSFWFSSLNVFFFSFNCYRMTDFLAVMMMSATTCSVYWWRTNEMRPTVPDKLVSWRRVKSVITFHPQNVAASNKTFSFLLLKNQPITSQCRHGQTSSPRKYKFSFYLLPTMPMESQVKFRSPEFRHELRL